MSILINNNKFTKVYFGGDSISKIYKGKDLVFQLSDSGGDDTPYTDDDFFEITTDKDLSLNKCFQKLVNYEDSQHTTVEDLLSDITIKANTPTVISKNSFTNYSTDVLGINFWYNYADAITSVKVLKGMNQFKYARDMFYGLTKLISIDLTEYNPTNLIDISWMFYGCTSLKSLSLSNINTENVTNMIGLFNKCSSLASLNISNLDTSNANDIQIIFNDCPNLNNIAFGSLFGKGNKYNGLTFEKTNNEKGYKFTDDTWNSMLKMYDRTSNGLTPIILFFNSSSNFPNGWIEAMNEKGYTISKT